MPYCRNCGSPVDANGACPNCSRSVPPTYYEPDATVTQPVADMPVTQPVYNDAQFSYAHEAPTAHYSADVPPAGYGMGAPTAPVTPAGAAPVNPKPKKKKKGLVAVVICLIVALLLATGAALYFKFFPKADSEESKSSKETNSRRFRDNEEDEEDDKQVETAQAPAMSSDWEDLTFEVDGVVYQIPCTLGTFLDNGWEIDTELEDWSEDDMVNGGEEVILLVKKEYGTVMCAYNPQKEAQALRDCDVILAAWMEEDGMVFADVELDDIGSTEDIIDIFGEPDYYSEDHGCVYEADNAVMEVCYNVGGYADVSYYTEKAVALGYAPAEEASAEEGLYGSGTDAVALIAAGEKPYEGQTLTVWTGYETGTATQEAADQWIARFEEVTGADIQVKHQGYDLLTLLYPALDAGEDIDVFLVGSTIQLNLQKDHALDITEYYNNSDMETRAYPIQMKTIKAVSEDGETIYGIPTVSSVNLWWYNKDIFDAAGVTKVPTTFEEFEAVCDKIVAAGYYPIALDDAYAPTTFGYMLGRLVGEDVVADLTVNGGFAENEAFVAACQKMIDWRAKGYFEPNAPAVWPNSQNRIGLMQDTAMVSSGMWIPSEIEDACGEKLNWGGFNMPIEPSCEDAKIGINPSCTVNMINVNTDTPDLAWDYLYFMCTGEADKAITDADDYLTNDMTNEALPKFQGAKDTLMTAENTVNYAGGMHANADIKTSINDVALRVMAGEFKTGLEAAQAFDALLQ